MTDYKKITNSDVNADRRINEDRRVNTDPTTFPIFAESNTWIRKECRKTPERRLKNISVTETHLKDEEFNKLFKEFS